MTYEAPAIVDYGSIADHTFATVPNRGGNIPQKNAPVGKADKFQECCSEFEVGLSH